MPHDTKLIRRIADPRYANQANALHSYLSASPSGQGFIMQQSYVAPQRRGLGDKSCWFVVPFMILESYVDSTGVRITQPIRSFKPYLLKPVEVAPQLVADAYYHESRKQPSQYLEVFN